MGGVTFTLKRVFEKGRLCFELPVDEYEKEQLKGLLSLCRNKYADYVQVTLKKPFKPRTTGPHSQNHHLNGHILQICREIGQDYETVKYCVKMTAVEQFGYPSKSVGGHIVPQRESDCSTEDCAQLIEAAHYLAADLGIILQE